MKKHFVFDFDDTISNSYDFNQDMFYQTFIPYYLDIDETFVRTVHRENRGKPMDYQFKLVIDGLNLELDPELLTQENEELHAKNFKDITLFSGVKELFTILKGRGKKISICTNRQYKSFNAVLKNQGLREYIEFAISCKDEGFEKPNPKCLLDLIEKSGDDKDEFIYFGDSKTDYEFASNAGVDFVIVDHYINGKNFYNMIIKAFL